MVDQRAGPVELQSETKLSQPRDAAFDKRSGKPGHLLIRTTADAAAVIDDIGLERTRLVPTGTQDFGKEAVAAPLCREEASLTISSWPLSSAASMRSACAGGMRWRWTSPENRGMAQETLTRFRRQVFPDRLDMRTHAVHHVTPVATICDMGANQVGQPAVR